MVQITCGIELQRQNRFGFSLVDYLQLKRLFLSASKQCHLMQE